MGYTRRRATVQSAEEFKHVKVVTGECANCERKFEATFEKKQPDTCFEPLSFDCPCGTYAFFPDDGMERMHDTDFDPAELRARTDRREKSLIFQS